MPCVFKYAECDSRPPEVKALRNGDVRVARKIESREQDGKTVWACEMAVMTPTEYAAYVGAKEVAERREAEIIDDYTMSLIEGGVI